MTLETIYIVTMWSGGRAARKWKTMEQPERLSTGTGVSFRSLDTKLPVTVIGNVSVEEYEQGSRMLEELERALDTADESVESERPQRPPSGPTPLRLL